MYGVHGFEGLFLVFPLLLWALGLFALYWVIRLGVRHGVLDAHRRRPPEERAHPDVLP